MFDERTEALAKELGARDLVPAGQAAQPRGQQDRDRAHRRQGRRAQRAQHAGQGRRLQAADENRREGRPGPRPGAAVGLRRFGPHHLLHQVRGRLPQARARDRRCRRDQDHEAHQLPRRGHRGLRHQAGHHRRPADDRAGRLSLAHALPRRLVRQRDLRQRLHPQDPREGARVHLQVRRAAAQGRLPRLLRAGLPGRPEHRARSTWASSTRASPAPAP